MRVGCRLGSRRPPKFRKTATRAFYFPQRRSPNRRSSVYVENDPVQLARVLPESIFVTTFTEKAARNLEDRISYYRNQIVRQRPELSAIDTSKLCLGTLHGLCNDLLQELRAPNYQNVRLMDELEASMFIYEHLSIIDSPNEARDRPFWTDFAYLFSPQQWQQTWRYLPSKWNMTTALVKLFNRIVEDRVSVAGMRAAGGQWTRLADLYDEYAAKLQSEHRCDFSHLQLRFLEFLQTPLGRQFRDGNPSDNTAGITWALIDEYQDTNLIQEEIYLTLAIRTPHNVVVVGDDDQALYRFRGGSVECMVTFDQACSVYLGVLPESVARYPLVANFRSHPSIVSFCNGYITAFASMALPRARVPNKPALIARSSIAGTYPSVGQLRAASMNDLADKFAGTVRDLVLNGVVQDYNQCCLLLKSTKESPNNAQKYVVSLRACGIPVYNPRNKGFLEQEEVLGLLGALLAITDSQGRNVPHGSEVKQAARRTHATRWNKEPWVPGAFSAVSPGGQWARRALAEPLRERLWFAGEAAHETLWGTVGGAREAGEVTRSTNPVRTS